MQQIHIIDGQQNVILDFITAKNIIDDTHKKSLEDTLETYNFITFADKRFSEFLEKRNRIIIPDEDGSLVEFVIFEAAKYKDTEGHKAQVYAHASYLELKKASVLYPDSGFTGTPSQHGGRVLNNTGWQIGIVEGKGTRTLSIANHTNPYEMLKRIAREFDLELHFRVTHDGNKITGRFVDLLERVGQWRGREVEFGKDLDGIRRVEKQDIVTALLGLGPEDEDGNRLEVLVTDDDALKRWGRIDEYGELKHLIEPYEIQSERSEMTVTEARQYTRTALDKRIDTQVTYETTIIDLEEVPGMQNKKIRFGDTIKIKDTKFNPPLYLEARVFEQNRSIKSKAKKDIKLGDFIEHTEEEVNAIWKQLQKQIQSRVSYYEMVEHTYDRLTIDTKDETIFEEGKTFAEATGVTAEENAKGFAVEEDKKIKVDVEQYADNVSEEKAQSALDQAKIYSVAQAVYDIQMQNIADDIEDRAPIEYVDGQMRIVDDRLDDFDVELDSKADGSNVYTISDVDNMINNTVSITQYTTDMDGIVTDLNSQGTRIGQNEEAISLKADSSDLNAVESSLTTQIGNVEVKADSVITSVSEVRADLDGLEIGGRNFIVLERLSSHTSYNSTPVSIGNEIRTIQNTDRTGQVNFTIAIDSFIPENRVYTVSGYLHINGEPLTKDIFRRERVSTYNSSNENIKFYVNESTGYFEFVEEYSGSHRWIFHSDTFLEQGDELIFRDLKFEKGNKATDWTPAPEDTDEAINQVSGRVETLDGEIKAVAGEVNLKASQSIVDSLENRVSTAEGELSVLPGQINAKVSKDGAFGELNLSPDKALLDFDRVNVTGKLEAKHIKSLAGLNVNDQFVVDSQGNVDFSGSLNGATGVFSGLIQAPQLTVEVQNKEQYADFGLRLQTAEWRSNTTNPYEATGYILFNTSDNGVEITKENLSGNRVTFDGFIVNAKNTAFNGRVHIDNQLHVHGSSTDGGISINGVYGANHYITGYTTHGGLVIYPARAEGEDRIRFRSHSGQANYVDDFRITTSGYLTMPNAHYRTSSSSANVRMNNNGAFYQTSSSRDSKLLIEDLKANPYSLLDLDPKDWFDKNDCERFSKYLSKEKIDEEDTSLSEIENLIRIPGLVAEDVEEVGLEQFVEYDSKGKVSGLKYDRLWIPLIPIVRDLKIELEELRNERSNL